MRPDDDVRRGIDMSAETAEVENRDSTGTWVWILAGTTHVNVHELPATTSPVVGQLDSGAYWATTQSFQEFVTAKPPYRSTSLWVLVDSAPTEDGGSATGWISGTFLDHPVPGLAVDI
jgi:hypothetical protein